MGCCASHEDGGVDAPEKLNMSRPTHKH